MKNIDRIILMHLLRSPLEYSKLPLTGQVDLTGYAVAMGAVLPRGDETERSEVLKALCQADRGYLDRWISDLLALYRGLPVEQGQELARQTIELQKADPDVYEEWAEEILESLACMVPGSLQGCHPAMVEAGIFSPDELYRDADPATRDQLIGWAEGTPPKPYISLLAYIGDEVVQQTFRRWRQSPPRWDREVAWRIDEYWARDAGWELTPTGSRRELHHQQCFTLVPADTAPSGGERGPVTVVTPHEEPCGWCGRPLSTMFDVDLRDHRLTFLAPGWQRLRIAMCQRCTNFGTIFTEVDGEGQSRWSGLNKRPEYIGEDEGDWRIPERRLILGPPRRSPSEAQFRFMDDGQSQLGGHPTWWQNTSHPRCPKCGRWMTFVGQLQANDALGEIGEGIWYGFLCQDCGTAAAAYECS
jgi:hypothetical protein